MAITKTHSIKSTLNLAIQYICNPVKTDGTLLVSSFACLPATADIEFEWTRRQAIDKGNSLGRHIIQSFSPDDNITPEQAHEIGMKLAEQVLGGEYEFVISTHTDKGHVHNHIIFNSVSFVDYKKYHSNKYTYRNIRKASDKLCEEYGLSVIAENKNKDKSYFEHTAYEKNTAWKAQLKQKIDTAIKRSMDFEDFLLRMELAGYEVKRGKYISFRAQGQQRFMRSKTLGERYTEEAIIKRIQKQRTVPKQNKSISLIIDIQNCIKAQESKGYEHWAKINNLKQASKTLNFLTENNITSYDELKIKIEERRKVFDNISDKLKSVEKKSNDTNILRKHISTYQSLKPVYDKYKTSKNKSEFENKHRREIILFEASHKYLSEVQTNGKLPTLEKVNTERINLEEQKQKLYSDYRKAKKELSEIDIVKSNVDAMLRTQQRNEPTIEQELE